MMTNVSLRMSFALGSAIAAVVATGCLAAQGGDADPEALGEATERVTLTAQVGTMLVGSGAYPGLKNASTSFATFPGPNTPLVLATTQGAPWQDTFAVTTTGISASGFSANVFRTDSASGWGQNLGLGWLAIAPTTQTHTQAGSADVGMHNSTQLTTVSVTFPHAFSAVPRVLLTPHGEPWQDTFSATTTSVTTTGFTANVFRVDSVSGWGQDLHLDWMAWDSLADLSALGVIDGTADMGSSGSKTPYKNVGVSFPQSFGTSPIVLATPRGEPWTDTFSVTAVSVNTQGFSANIHRDDSPTNGWGQDLHLDWIAFPAAMSCPAGQTLVSDTGTCVTLTPWNGGALPSGAKIALLASKRFKNDNCSGCTGTESFGPSWVKLTSYRWNTAVPNYDYLDASGSALTSKAIFNTTTVPRGANEYIAGNNPCAYQKLLIQGSDGLYATVDSSGEMITAASQSDAAIMILDLTQGTKAGFYWTGYSNSQNADMMNDDYIWTGGFNFYAINGLTFYQFNNGGFSPTAGFSQLYIVQ